MKALTVNIPPYGSHPAKKAGDFKVGETIIMAQGREYTIIEIIAVTIASNPNDSFLEFSLNCPQNRKSKLTKKADDLLGCKPKQAIAKKRAFF